MEFETPRMQTRMAFVTRRVCETMKWVKEGVGWNMEHSKGVTSSYFMPNPKSPTLVSFHQVCHHSCGESLSEMSYTYKLRKRGTSTLSSKIIYTVSPGLTPRSNASSPCIPPLRIHNNITACLTLHRGMFMLIVNITIKHYTVVL